MGKGLKNIHFCVFNMYKNIGNRKLKWLYSPDFRNDIVYAAAAAAKPLQLCPTVCDPIDGSPPGSPIPGSLQARTLEWVAISFSNA